MRTRIFIAIEVIGWLVLAGGVYYFIRIIAVVRSPAGQLQFGLDNTALAIAIGAVLAIGPGLLLVRIGQVLRKRSQDSVTSQGKPPGSSEQP